MSETATNYYEVLDNDGAPSHDAVITTTAANHGDIEYPDPVRERALELALDHCHRLQIIARNDIVLATAKEFEAYLRGT